MPTIRAILVPSDLSPEAEHALEHASCLAQRFGAALTLYHAVPVLQSGEENIRNARLRLVAAAKQTLANALRLLDIKAPEVM